MLLEHLVVAIHQLPLVVTKVHAATLAELPHLAILALILLGPLTVAELLEAVLPHIPELVPIYIALSVVGSHACASRDIAIDTYRGYIPARSAHVEVITYESLVATQEALAGVA